MGVLTNVSALGDYQKPMTVLNQVVSNKAAAGALTKAVSWMPQASR
jgi:hypothetical protein